MEIDLKKGKNFWQGQRPVIFVVFLYQNPSGRGSAPKDVSGRCPSVPVVSTICYKSFGALPLPKVFTNFCKNIDMG